ncbi:MAG: fumarylacetoacetate hydrolase family protein [Alphaproteobacteria bacterium]|nr:fumarylacetoacetate hydrolase family protein [Alphaproteobacteria bacterium]MBU1562975.1 fumarylacetoacetate hydrolase family protein [Alphaproteobacteria bacterium]MBU2304170.1 fumarylacetoacetate hydrolase family protein [Alphaproteobacteria bacterium]MBU2367459.1 fumarylacetoacetate hydrolase family protein [Alphaproteobacteria bacterium]
MTMINSLSDLADAFNAGHDGGPLIDSVPDSLTPADMAAVYALQDMVISRLGPVGGWKIMAGGQGEPVCAPIPANRYFDNGASIDSTRYRFVFPEVEVAVKLGQDLPADADAAAVEAAIASLHPVLEMIGSPFVDRDAIHANVKLGDLQSNGAVVVGPAFDPAIKAELATLPVSLLFDGVEAKTTSTGASWTAIFDAVTWLARHANTRGLPLKAGQVIITGSRVLAPHGKASSIEGRMGDWGSVTARMTY